MTYLLFNLQSNDTGETSSQSSKSSNSSQTTVTLAKHGKLHSQLQMYAPLMHWLKATDYLCYEKLLEVYTNSICKLYERDLRQFFEEARLKVIGLRERKSECMISIYILKWSGNFLLVFQWEVVTLGLKLEQGSLCLSGIPLLILL